MIKRVSCILFFLLTSIPTFPQLLRIAELDTMTTTTKGHIAVGGYVDSYYAYSFNKPSDHVIPYFVSSARHNELNINLAYADVRYRSAYLRARLAPGFGTYMEANYKNENGLLKHIVEGNIGVLVSRTRKIWIDAGVLGSPYTNETAISKDHFMYLRSLAPENVPYYITGAKVSVPLTSRLHAFLYLINGWQLIQDNNKGKSLGTQLQYKLNKNLTFNWNTYLGDERSEKRPELRTRYFNDFYWIYNSGKKISATSCFYFGYQQMNNTGTANWWQVNLITNYALNNFVSLSGRIEHFSDPRAVIYQGSITGLSGFKTSSTGACVNFKFFKSALLRFEGRRFFSQDKVYQDQNMNAKRTESLLVAAVTAWL